MVAWIVVMGVSGCGKSHTGARIAETLGLPLIEGDEFHPEANRARMRSGIALTDADRAGWLQTLGEQLQQRRDGAVLTCSALKRAYRDRLRSAMPGLRFVWLDLDRATAEARVGHRGGHFFPPQLVATQFEALEPPLQEADVLRVDALRPPDDLSSQVACWLGISPTPGAP